MNWIETPESSNVMRFSYQEQNQTLIVEFKNGGTYQYFDVPSNVFEQMKAASSKGQFIAIALKGVYRFSRM